MKKSKQQIYELDNSGIMHLSLLRDGKPNVWRISLTMHETVDRDILQQAVNAVCPRFPYLVAGIRRGFTKHYLVPSKTIPTVIDDRENLAFMTREEIERCGFRVLCADRKISIEVFHSITDGYGGFVFMNALACEYLRLKKGISFEDDASVIKPDSPIDPAEFEDGYTACAGMPETALNSTASYQLPGENLMHTPLHTTTAIFNVQDILSAARQHKTSITGFLTAVMAHSILEIQAKHGNDSRPVQLMVPINLRNMLGNCFCKSCNSANDKEQSA